MKKRIISLLMALALCLSLLPTTAWATGNADWEKLGAALAETASTLTANESSSFTVELITGGYRITLQEDITADVNNTTLNVKGTKVLDLNGHVINAAGKLPNDAGSVITVNSGAELTLTDSGNTVRYYDKDAKGLWTLAADQTTPTDYITTGGVITGGTGTSDRNPNPNYNGGGVYVQEDGTLNMHGGNITGNTAKSNGGGVYIYKGSLTMTGGTISGNTANSYGGGVAVNAGHFTMSGSSKVANNKAGGAGGVYVNGDFKMVGGSVDHNTASGGGVFIASGGTVTLGGSAKITDNTNSNGTTASNFYLSNDKTVTLGTGTGVDKNGVAVPKTGMKVGVTKGYDESLGVFTTNGTADDVQYFFSDNPVYAVTHKNNSPELIKSWPELKDVLSDMDLTTDDSIPGLFDVKDGTITLLTDFKAASGEPNDETLTVPADKTVTLDLNGHVINADGKLPTSAGSVITVNGNLTLKDSTIGTGTAPEHYFKVGDNGLWTLTNAKTATTKTVVGGVITGGTGTSIDVDSSTTELEGGGIYVASGAFLVMNGGSIVGCSADKGGGVFTWGNMAMSVDSAIRGCTATVDGGGVCACNCEVTMNDSSKVSDCTAGNGAGGVYTWAGSGETARFAMNNDSIISNCSASASASDSDKQRSGGGVCVEGTGCTFTMNGGTISGNTSNADGGGVCFMSGSATLGGKAKITGNTAKEKANNLYLESGKTITLGNGLNDAAAPAEGMNVGVTMGGDTGAFTSDATTADTSHVKYFTSDSADYYVTCNKSKLSLAGVGGNVAQNIDTGELFTTVKDAVSDTDTVDSHTIRMIANSTENVTIAIGKTITLDLNGKVLSASAAGSSVITVGGTGNLTLMDSNPTAAHKFGDTDGLWTWNDALDGDNIKHTVTGGVITGGTDSAVKVCGDSAGQGVFTMTGGNIVGNTADNGAGVHLEATSGSKDEIYPCTFNMTGGRIIGNRATGYDIFGWGHYSGMGGGILMNGAGSRFKMTGGEICRNTTDGNGGGVGVSDGTITLGGTAKITGNTAGSETKSTNNLYLPLIGYDPKVQKTVTLGDGTNGDAPATGFSVGVTMQTPGVFSGANVADYSALFTPDAGVNYKVVYNKDKKLELVKESAVTVDPDITNGTVTTSATNKKAFSGDAVTVTVTPASGYQLKSLTVTDADSAPVAVTGNTFTMPAKAVTVTAEFEKIHTGGGSSTPTVTVPVSGDKDSVKVTATVSGGNATVKNVTSEQLETVGTGENVTIDLSNLSKSVSGVTIPKTTFENVAKSDADGLEVKLPNGTTAVFDSTTVAAVAEQAAGSNIQLVVDKENKAEQALTAAQKETVKALNDALVLDAYFVSNGKRISDFKGGEAELTVSYPTTKPVRVWYVAEDGTKELVPSTFDGKAAKFVVTHFSHYAIEILDGSSYTSCPQDATCPMAAFGDLNLSAWYHDGVHYCVENGMMNGVSNTQFAPNGTLTRGMVVTVLWRLENSPVVNYAMSFKDVPAGRWYTEAVRWAQSVKVVEGYDEASFGPNDNVTREQLAAILYRYALLKKVDVDEITKDTNTLSHNDVFTISDWATSGMHFCIAAGVVNGDDNGNLNPHSTATRAEAATMFQRFSEKVVK